MSKLKNKIIYIVIIVLSLTYVLSFINVNKDKRTKVKTALINPDYKDKITFMEFYDGDNQKITLVKSNGFWEIQTQIHDVVLKMPANYQKIESFLNLSTQILNMYKISDTFTPENSFLILQPGSIQLKYGFDDKKYELFFGGQDFSHSSRYLMTGKSTNIYEISNVLDNYLTVSQQFWSDPKLISSEVLGKISQNDIQRNYLKIDGILYEILDLQKLLDLRHGGFSEISENYEINENSEPQAELFLELGNKNTVKLEFFQENDASFIEVKSTYHRYSDINNGKNSEIYSFNSKISQWTYNKILP